MHALSRIRTHFLSVQAIKACASDAEATGIGVILMSSSLVQILRSCDTKITQVFTEYVMYANATDPRIDESCFLFYLKERKLTRQRH
jgi:hypothetical protein